MLCAALVAFTACDKDDEPVKAPNESETEQPVEEPEPQPDPEPDPDPIVTAVHPVAKITINTENAAPVVSKKDYVNCTVSIKCENEEYNLEATASIRGRGNSTWLWYPKKPYRVKFDEKVSIFGMGEGKKWAFLANYRDPTDMMNVFVFELGQLAALPYTNHNYFAELTLNGEEIGLYQITEQVEQGKGRVNVDKKEGYLLSLDVDDGPAESPDAIDNFWSIYYDMPVCVKHPEDPENDVLMQVREDFGVLETTIKGGNYDDIKEILDVQSMIDFIMIQEFVYNVELDAPRSMYIHRDKDSKWTMGPLWDFDAGYDFDWTNMTESHRFFTEYNELVLGTNPATHSGTGYRVPGFFSDLFKIREFVADYQTRWRQMKVWIPEAWTKSMEYYDQAVWQREEELWPIGRDHANELKKMENWINNRIFFLDNIIAGY